MRFRVEGLGFRDWRSEFGILGIGYRVSGFGFRVQGLESQHVESRPLLLSGLPEVFDALLVGQVARAIGPQHPVLLSAIQSVSVSERAVHSGLMT